MSVLEEKYQLLVQDVTAVKQLMAAMVPTEHQESLIVLQSFLMRYRLELVRMANEHPSDAPEEALLAAWPGLYRRVTGEGEQAQARPQATQHVNRASLLGYMCIIIHVLAAACTPSALFQSFDTCSNLVLSMQQINRHRQGRLKICCCAILLRWGCLMPDCHSVGYIQK